MPNGYNNYHNNNGHLTSKFRDIMFHYISPRFFSFLTLSCLPLIVHESSRSMLMDCLSLEPELEHLDNCMPWELDEKSAQIKSEKSQTLVMNVKWKYLKNLFFPARLCCAALFFLLVEPRQCCWERFGNSYNYFRDGNEAACNRILYLKWMGKHQTSHHSLSFAQKSGIIRCWSQSQFHFGNLIHFIHPRAHMLWWNFVSRGGMNNDKKISHCPSCCFCIA